MSSEYQLKLNEKNTQGPDLETRHDGTSNCDYVLAELLTAIAAMPVTNLFGSMKNCHYVF